MMMKKITRYFTLPMLLILCMLLVSCNFVSYVLYPQEQEKEADFEEVLSDYLAQLEDFSSTEQYRDAEQPLYKAALLDAKNELNECTTVAQLDEVFEKHLANLEAIPTHFQLTVTETVDEVNRHISLEDYREEEQVLAQALIEEYTEKILAAESVEEIEKLFRSFEFDIFTLKTDAQYYAEELDTLKQELEALFAKKPVYSEYTTADLERVEALIREFEEALALAETKENANELFDSFCNTLSAIPTISDIEMLERLNLVLEWQDKFTAFAQEYDLVMDAEIEQACEELRLLSTVYAINREAAQFLIDKIDSLGDTAVADLRENCKIYLENMAPVMDYRTEQQNRIQSLLSTVTDAFSAATQTREVQELFEQAKTDMQAIPTSDLLWKQEDQQFLSDLADLYGNNTLQAPESLYEASSYEEMAAIIDYYAFYQISNTAFLRDTFRIKLLYSYRSAQFEINEVYWYCELLRGAVGITGHLEITTGGHYLVVELVPYAMATVTNADPSPYVADRYESRVSYKQSSATYTARGDDFEDFAYLTQYEKTLSGVWNSHQLWYAFEHGYIPLVVENSPAERVLEECKRLLRELILDGMTDEEKIFAIFEWYGKYVQFDDGYADYLYPEDREHFPDSLVATLNSYHMEGALFDHLATCESSVKAMLVLLRMEGIECYRIFTHAYWDNAIDNLGRFGYGSHALLSIKLSDGSFYLSDPYEAYQHNTTFPKYHQFLIPWNLQITYPATAYTRVFTNLTYGKTILPSVRENLVYNDTPIFVNNENQLQKILSDFAAETDSHICVSIFEYDIQNAELGILDAIKASSIAYYTVSHKGLVEYILYK